MIINAQKGSRFFLKSLSQQRGSKDIRFQKGLFESSYNVETISLLLTDLAKFVSFLFLHKTILIIYKHIKTISDQLFMSVTSVCQTLYDFIHSQHHRFSGFLHLLVSQHLQALEQGSENRTQVHRRFRQLCLLEHPQNASCMPSDDTTSWVISFGMRIPSSLRYQAFSSSGRGLDGQASWALF